MRFALLTKPGLTAGQRLRGEVSCSLAVKQGAGNFHRLDKSQVCGELRSRDGTEGIPQRFDERLCADDDDGTFARLGIADQRFLHMVHDVESKRDVTRQIIGMGHVNNGVDSMIDGAFQPLRDIDGSIEFMPRPSAIEGIQDDSFV